MDVQSVTEILELLSHFHFHISPGHNPPAPIISSSVTTAGPGRAVAVAAGSASGSPPPLLFLVESPPFQAGRHRRMCPPSPSRHSGGSALACLSGSRQRLMKQKEVDRQGKRWRWPCMERPGKETSLPLQRKRTCKAGKKKG